MSIRPWVADAAGREAAWTRAENLLRDSLTPDQYDAYLRRGYIEIPSRLHPRRMYRIDGWRPVAVFEEGGRFAGAVCLRPRENLPGPDVILAQKLYIEGAEEEFLRAGNWLSPAWRPTTAAPTAVLVAVLLGPWLVNLVRYGARGLVLAAVLICAALVVGGARLWVRRRRRAAARSAAAEVPVPQAG